MYEILRKAKSKEENKKEEKNVEKGGKWENIQVFCFSLF